MNSDAEYLCRTIHCLLIFCGSACLGKGVRVHEVAIRARGAGHPDQSLPMGFRLPWTPKIM